MGIILFVISWMLFNCFLAAIAVVSGWLMLLSRSRKIMYIFLLIWLLFIPNTVYLLTDVAHLFEDWNTVAFYFKPILILLYAALIIVSIISFIAAIYPFELLLKLSKNVKKNYFAVLVLLNFGIGFAIVLGRVKRVSSWEVITNIPKVSHDIFNVLATSELLLLAIGLGVIVNGIYFCTKNLVKLRGR